MKLNVTCKKAFRIYKAFHDFTETQNECEYLLRVHNDTQTYSRAFYKRQTLEALAEFVGANLDEYITIMRRAEKHADKMRKKGEMTRSERVTFLSRVSLRIIEGRNAK